MDSRAGKFALLLSVVLSLLAFWDHESLHYLKEFVVLVHEFCHATAALFTGGKVQSILIHGDESGETIASPSHFGSAFVFVVSSGYVGSSVIGAYLMHKGFSGTQVRETSLLFGSFVLVLSLLYSGMGEFTFLIGASWGLGIILLGLLGRAISSLGLVFLGASVSLYSLYDLSDFAEAVHYTDAGILAYWITGYTPAGEGERVPSIVLTLGYLIAILWSFLSIGIVLVSLRHSLRPEEELEPTPVEEESLPTGFAPGTGQPYPGELTPEVIEWFLARGLDLNGNPLPPELTVDLRQNDRT